MRYLLVLVIFFVFGNAQIVNVTIFTESQCPFCTRLLREQICKYFVSVCLVCSGPFHVTRPGIMNLQVIL